MLKFVIGLVVGVFLGVLIMSCVTANEYHKDE